MRKIPLKDLLTVETRRTEDGKLDQMTLTRPNKKPVWLQMIYGTDGFLKKIVFRGRKADMPSIPEVIALVNEKFMERIGAIRTIDRIGDIDLSVEGDTGVTKTQTVTHLSTIRPKSGYAWKVQSIQFDNQDNVQTTWFEIHDKDGKIIYKWTSTPALAPSYHHLPVYKEILLWGNDYMTVSAGGASANEVIVRVKEYVI